MSNEGLGLLSAPLVRRSSAFAIDALCLGILAIPGVFVYPTILGALTTGEVPPLSAIVPLVVGYALSVILVVVQLVLHGLRGFTIGKRLLGLRSVNVDTLGKPGFWRIVLRALVLSVAAVVVPVLGGLVLLASPIWANNRTDRGWLDLIGRTWLLDVRAGLDPYDAKALRLARREVERANQPTDAAVPSLATGAEGRVTFVTGSRSRSSIVAGSAVAVTATDEPAAQPAKPQPTPGLIDLPPAPVATSAPAVVAEPAVATPPATAATPATAHAVLVDHESTRYVVEGTALIGRNPAADPAHPEFALISVFDGTMSMSKTHARLDVFDAGVRVTDLGSSNGSAVLDDAGVAAPIATGESSLVAWGATMRLGDRPFAVYPHSSGSRGDA